jgi:hypothetical protein
MPNEMQELIEAAERQVGNCRCYGSGMYSYNPEIVPPQSCVCCQDLRNAIATAKLSATYEEYHGMADAEYESDYRPARASEGGWIEIKDGCEMPPESSKMLIFVTKSGMVYQAWYNKGVWRDVEGFWPASAVSHFQPLPSPPLSVEKPK